MPYEYYLYSNYNILYFDLDLYILGKISGIRDLVTVLIIIIILLIFSI